MTTKQSKALLYVRVSTMKQVTRGASLDAQERELIAEAERRGLPYEVIREEGKSAKAITARPELIRAIELLDKGEASHLIAHRLDRVSRSVSDFSWLLSRATKKGWAVVVLDVDVDTSTPTGEFLVNVIASASQFEARIIGARTREAMAEHIKQGRRFGRPCTLSPETVLTIKELRKKGRTLLEITDQLNREQVKTARGGLKWYTSTVSSILRTHALANN